MQERGKNKNNLERLLKNKKLNRNLYKVRISYFFMEITKLSSKGQIVIPKRIRKDMKVGDPLLVTKTNDLIVLKRIKKITKEEMRTIKSLEKVWKDIEAGKGKKFKSVDEFLEKLKRW